MLEHIHANILFIDIKLLRSSSKLPTYAKEGDSGMDLYADIPSFVSIPSGGWAIIPVGFALALPVGLEMQIRPRSGTANKHGITVLNAPGTVDSPYRGEVGVLVINHGPTEFVVLPGDRIAQGVIAPVIHAYWRQVDELPESDRGEGGWGHTGTSSPTIKPDLHIVQSDLLGR